MRKIVALLLIAVLTATVYAQNNCNCEKMDVYLKKRDYDSVVPTSKNGIWADSKLFLSNKSIRCKAFGVHLLGLAQLKAGQINEAKVSIDREKFMLDSIRCKPQSYVEYFILLGDYYSEIGSYPSATDQYNRAFTLLNKAKNKPRQAYVMIQLSKVWFRQNEFDKSKGYLYQAAGVIPSLTDNESKVNCLLGLSSRYLRQYQHSNDVLLLDSAERTAQYGILLSKNLNFKSGLIEGYNLLEDKAYYLQNYRLALTYLDSALSYTQVNYSIQEREAIFGDLSDIYLDLKKYDKAYQYADSNYTYALKIGNPYQVKGSLEILYNASKLSGEYERALEVYEDLALMRDSVLKIQSLQKYAALEDKYHKARKEKTQAEYEQDKALLEQQRKIGSLRKRLITVGIVIFTLLSGYIFIVFRQKSIKQRQKKLEIQQRLFRARINPDFIYTTLSSLQNNSSETMDYKKKVNGFAKLVKQVLESSYDDFLTLDKEIEFLSFYLDLQKDRLKQDFDFTFEVDDHLDPSDVCVPTLILQPFIESTVEEGFKNLGKKGELQVRFKLTDQNELSIVIQDNGKGLKAVDSTRASEIINDRLYLLNKVNKSTSSYLVRERSTGGVSVEIFLPLITKASAEELRKHAL